MRFTVFDLETENCNDKKFSDLVIGKNPSYQWHPSNYIVSLGLRTYDIDPALNTIVGSSEYYIAHVDSTSVDIHKYIRTHMDEFESTTLVAHNIKFDLLWLLQYDENNWLDEMFTAGHIDFYDTMLLAYIRSGCTHKMISLANLYDIIQTRKDSPAITDEIEYSGHLHLGKGDIIKQYYEDGKSVSQIPKIKLDEYLKGDLDTTAYCYAYLYSRIDSPKQAGLVTDMMASMLGTTWMEFNGMYYDADKSVAAGTAMEAALVTSNREVTQKYLLGEGTPNPPLLPPELIDMIDAGPRPEIVYESFITSPTKLSSLLFGGTVKVVMHVEKLRKDGLPDVYKSGAREGEVKTRMETREFVFSGLLSPLKYKSKLSSLGYSVDDTVINYILKDITVEEDLPIVGLLSHVKYSRMYSKILKSYLYKLPKLTWNSKIHHQLNHCVTSTGRLSSTSPNLQNVSRVDESLVSHAVVKNYFHSRYPDGLLIEADYSQLEVVILAVITKCKRLLKDLSSGVDIHRRNAMKLFDHDNEKAVTPEERRLAKTLSFELQYGAGAASMSYTHDIPLDLAEKFIANYFSLYPEIAQCHSEWVREYRIRRKKGKTVYITTPTGRRLAFTDTETGKVPVTKIKNYRIQSVATADVVPLAIGEVCTEIRCSDLHVVPINTIHDSIMLDAQNESELPEIVDLLRKSMVDLVLRNMKLFYEVEIPKRLLNIDIKAGKTWSTMTDVNL